MIHASLAKLAAASAARGLSALRSPPSGRSATARNQKQIAGRRGLGLADSALKGTLHHVRRFSAPHCRTGSPLAGIPNVQAE
jgi:hypothetical protein